MFIEVLPKGKVIKIFEPNHIKHFILNKNDILNYEYLFRSSILMYKYNIVFDNKRYYHYHFLFHFSELGPYF